MKFSTPFLFLKNVAYDPLIYKFPISAAVQRGKAFFARSKVFPKSHFHVPGTGAEISPRDVIRCANPSVCHSFYYKHVVNHRNFKITFTPKFGCCDQTRHIYINLPSVFYCTNFGGRTVRTQFCTRFGCFLADASSASARMRKTNMASIQRSFYFFL